MRLRTLLPALLGLALLVPGPSMAAAPAGPGPSTSLSLSLGSCGFSGTASGISGNQLTIKHRSATGVLKASHTVDTSGGGWSVACPGPRIRGGDRLRLFSGGASAPFRTFTVPALTIRTDRANDRVTGRAPRTSTVAVRVTGCDASGFACTANLPQIIPVNPDTSRFSIQTDDLKGGWSVELQWVKGQNEVSLSQHVAQVIVQAGKAMVRGWAQRPGVRVAVSLRRGQTVGLTSPRATADAAFHGTFRRGGSRMTVRTLDLVSSSVAGDAVFTVPATSLTLVSGGVTGRCFKNRPVTMLTYDATGAGPQDWELTTADADGRWTADTSLNAGWIVKAWCATAKGDVVLRTLVAN